MENLYLNPVVLKVHNGTRRSDINLCLTCRCALHSQSALSNRETIICSATGPSMRVLEPVVKCSGYLDRTKPSLMDMQEIAWSLQTDKGGRSIGFMSPEDLHRRDQTPNQPTQLPGFGA